MTIIAIDPGKSGGIASSDGWAVPMPATPKELLLTIQGARAAVAYIEEVGGYAGGAGAPGAAMFNFGEQYGSCVMALLATGFEVRKVRPQKWQKALSLGNSVGMTKTQWKNKLKAKAEELFPRLKVTLKTADALLILHAAQRQLI